MPGAEDSIPAVLFRQIDPKVLENARQQRRASFFEDEGLAEFLHLEWNIEVKEDLVLEFIENYHGENRTVIMSTGELPVDDELMLEVFHLPLGTYKMPKTSRLVSPYFPDFRCRLSDCNNVVWKDRFEFLHSLFSLRSKRRSMPHYFLEFLQAEGKKRNWVDAFRRFFEAEISRIRTSKQANLHTTIGSHISLLLAHAGKKKRPHAGGAMQKRLTRAWFTDPKQKSVTKEGVATHKADRKDSGPQTSTDDDQDEWRDEETERNTVSSRVTWRRLARKKTGGECKEPQILSDEEGKDEDNEAEEEEEEGGGEGKNHQDDVEEGQPVHPSLNTVNVEDQILRHYDLGRQGINELLKKVELWKSEYGNRIAVLLNENELLKNEVENWKRHYGKAEEARKELETKVTSFWTTTKLGTTENTSKLTRPFPEDISWRFASPLSKKAKATTSPKTENDGT